MVDTGAGRTQNPGGPATRRPRRRFRVRFRPGRAAAAGLVALTVAACSGGGSNGPAAPSAAPTTVTATPAGATPSAAGPSASAGAGPGSGATSPAAGGRTAPPGAGSGPVGAGYQPLFPFSTLGQADSWRRAYAAGGTQPWHLDPAATTAAFTAHLGLTGVRRVLSSTISGREAQVRVGFAVPDAGPRTGTAAVVHLVRFGTSSTAPWEIVGTNDTTFSLTTPGYGATVRSPLVVGGRITGVDESIRVTVYGPASATPLGVACCVAAGGTGSPWRARVAFRAPPGTVLTVVVTTGGHVAPVERFAVTAVRTS